MKSFPVESGPCSSECTYPCTFLIIFQILGEIKPISGGGFHNHRGLEYGYQMPLEPADPTGGRLPGILWTGQPSQPFQAAAALIPHEDVVTDPTGKIVALTL